MPRPTFVRPVDHRLARQSAEVSRSIDVASLASAVERDVLRGLVPTNALCGRYVLLDEESRRSPAFQDRKYIPAYYHLAKRLRPQNFVEYGFRLGLLSGAVMQGCCTVRHFLGFQRSVASAYSPRFAVRNLRFSYPGPIECCTGTTLGHDLGVSLARRTWDLAVVNDELTYDEHRLVLDVLWDSLCDGGLIVCDYLVSHKAAGDAFRDFCKVSNRTPAMVRTRYGMGLVSK